MAREMRDLRHIRWGGGFSGTILKRVWEGLDMEIRFNLSSDEFELLRECAESRGVSMDMLLTARDTLERDKVYGNIEVSDLLNI